jgi:virulence factor Mce-like protein
MRRRHRGLLLNPVLIGAITTLVAVIAVFLAYNANNGLPFTPGYALTVELPDAANLVRGNDVRIAGVRVGAITSIAPRQDPHTGAAIARLDLKLQPSAGPLPVDSTVIVRSRSALGLKYLEVVRGSAATTLPSGATLPLANARPEPVELDQVLNMFDARTRAASQANLVSFGDTFAGRGTGLNATIGQLTPLLRDLAPVAQNLAAPQTRLAHLFEALNRAAAQVAPVAETQAGLFRNLDATFAQLAGVARPFIQQSIQNAPPALEQAIRSFASERPFIAKTTNFMRLLRPSAQALRGAAPALAGALHAGATNFGPADALNRRLATSLTALQSFAQDPLVTLGLGDVTQTAQAGAPIAADLAGAQTVCNYVTLFFRNVASLLSEGDSIGTWQRFVIVLTPSGPNNEGVPAAAPANGPGNDNHLHVNPYPNVAAPGQPRECEAANESYLAGTTVTGNVPGNVGTATDVTTRAKGLK